MIVKVDTRETSLLFQINRLKTIMPIFKNITILTEALPLGDIIICEGKNEKLIIERKTASDLLSSIKDGRYEEQSYRLNGVNHHNHNIIYLIEGEMMSLNRFKSNENSYIITDKLTFYSAMFSLNYYKGFSVFRSNSLEETALIICNMAYKLEKETCGKKAFYQNPSDENNLFIASESLNGTDSAVCENLSIESDENVSKLDTNIICSKKSTNNKDYANVIKKVKKDNITPDNIGSIMLCQIPGISSVTALAIMEKFKTLPNLIKEIEANKDCLKDIASINEKGQKRKINKTCIANLIKFLANLQQ
jgi:crossover junction endonuclease MUS81